MDGHDKKEVVSKKKDLSFQEKKNWLKKEMSYMLLQNGMSRIS
jgi:hypothetical protein